MSAGPGPGGYNFSATSSNKSSTAENADKGFAANSNSSPVAADQPRNETPQALKGYINAIVYRKKDRLPNGAYRNQRYQLSDPDVLPLKTGDGICIEARLNRPAYMYIVWLDTEGKVSPLFPWDENWNLDPKLEVLRQILSVPGDWKPSTQVAPLGAGPRGMESIFLLARDEKLPPGFDLRPIFAGLPRQNGLDLGSAIWLDNGEVVLNEGESRPIKFKPAIDDPVLHTHKVLFKRLRPLFSHTRAVCFSNMGDE